AMGNLPVNSHLRVMESSLSPAFADPREPLGARAPFYTRPAWRQGRLPAVPWRASRARILYVSMARSPGHTIDAKPGSLGCGATWVGRGGGVMRRHYGVVVCVRSPERGVRSGGVAAVLCGLPRARCRRQLARQCPRPLSD